MKKILVAGAGQIGSRHLQALAKSSFDIDLYVYDRSDQSLEISKSRFEEIPENSFIKSIQYINSLELLPEKIELLVLSTPASVRLQAFKEIAAQSKVLNVLFEKVLFQSSKEIAEADEILNEKGINAWVNCPKRLYDVNEKIISAINDDSTVEYIVEGGNWGIGCNAIHFIDHMSCLTGDVNYELKLNKLDQKIHESKRAGFVDFTGTLEISFSKGHSMKLIATPEEKSRYDLKIKIDNQIFEMDEFTNELRVRDLEGNLIENIKYNYPFQSDMTQNVAQSILFKNQCRLPDFNESSHLHRQMLEPLLSFYKELGGELSRLPIT